MDVRGVVVGLLSGLLSGDELLVGVAVGGLDGLSEGELRLVCLGLAGVSVGLLRSLEGEGVDVGGLLRGFALDVDGGGV